MTDRELQDEIIRYMTDPQARRGSGELSPGALKLSAKQAARAAHFARFLARRYYRDRLGRSFRYSAALVAGRRAADVVDADNFEALMSEGTLGSFALAQSVGECAVAWLNAAGEQKWWPALLEYERAHFVQTATSEMPVPTKTLRRGLSTICVAFDWDMPELLRRIKTKQAIAEDLRRKVTLLFSRTRGGRIYVMDVDGATAAIFEAADGRRGEQEIAQAAGVESHAAKTILNSLIEIGAVIAAGVEAEAGEVRPERVLGI